MRRFLPLLVTLALGCAAAASGTDRTIGDVPATGDELAGENPGEDLVAPEDPGSATDPGSPTTDLPFADVPGTDLPGTDTPVADTPATGTDGPATTADDAPATAPDDASGTSEEVVEVPLAGFGTLTGDCGFLDDTEWDSSDPALFRNSLDFGTATFDPSLLSPGGQQIIADGNLGGSSVDSEAIAYDILYRCELAQLIKSEAQIVYQDTGGKKTDELVTIDGRKVGVSVTRAYKYPPTDPYTADDATKLLNKKLGDILLSAANAAPADAWERSILSVLAWDDAAAQSIAAAWLALPSGTRASTLLVVTTTGGNDDFVYSD